MAMRRRFAGIPGPSWVAVVAAGIVVALFVPFPPLMVAVRSKEWALLIEWLLLCGAFLVLLSWMEGSNMELEISTSGIKIRRMDKEDSEALRQELKEARDDLELYRRLTRELAEERSLLTAERGGAARQRTDEGKDV
jgi:hypothetical protein